MGVPVSINVIIKNKSSIFSCSWAKTLNNKILICKKKLVKNVGQKSWWKKIGEKIGVFKISSENVIFKVCL